MRLIDADEFKRVAAGCVFETPKGIRIKAEIAIDARPAVDAEPVRNGWSPVLIQTDPRTGKTTIVKSDDEKFEKILKCIERIENILRSLEV